MHYTRMIVGITTVIVFGLTHSLLPAAAQQISPTVIAIVDVSHVVRESIAGKSIRKQTDEQQTNYQAEIQNFQNELEQARKELSRQQTILSPEAFKRNRQEFEERARKLQTEVQKRKRELSQKFGQGMQYVEHELIEVLQEIAKEKGFNLVLNASRSGALVYADRELVITDEVLARLNKRIQVVPLEVKK